MSQFDTFDDPDSGGSGLRQLPLYVEPREDEVLLSWLLRLATRLEVSLNTLVRGAFWIDDRRERLHWWRRPEPQMLSRVGVKTGVSIERLRGMTLENWSPVYRADEDNERFSAQRFRAEARGSRGFRYVFCEQCLDRDSVPNHLRTPWTIGWVAVCPEHASIMTVRCRKCRAKLRVGRTSSIARFAPTTCVQCGNDLRYGLHDRAHPSVIRLQHALLEGKRQGTTGLAGIGHLSWMEVVALVDVVLGMLWTDTTPSEQQRAYSLVLEEFEISETQLGLRYIDLAIFAWLTEGWPHGTGPQIAMDMLARWLSNKPNRIFRHLGVQWSDPWNPGVHEIPEHIRERFRQLLVASHAAVS